MTTGTTAAVQGRTTLPIDVLLADFQGRAEPQFAWKSCVSQFLALPGLRALWPMSSVYDTGARCIDLSGQGNHLTDNAASTFGQLRITPMTGSGSTQYLYRVDGAWADISGTETFVASNGLTWGGWFFAQATSTLEHVFTKWGAAGQRSFNIRFTAADVWEAAISDDGTNSTTATTTETTTLNEWTFVVGRFDPGASVDIWVNRTLDSQATARASVFNSTADVVIGASHGGSSGFIGRRSMCFLSCMYIPDHIILQLYEQTRTAFIYGVFR